MKGRWLTVAALLFGAEATSGFETNTDGSVNLLAEHMDALESTLKEQSAQLAANEAALAEANRLKEEAIASAKTTADSLAASTEAVTAANEAKAKAEETIAAQNTELEALRAKVAGIPQGEGKDPKNTGGEGGGTPKNETPWRIKK